jgi:hypothetical protein
VWSTWAQYKADINASVVLGFGQEIASRGFAASQLEIDDNWEAGWPEKANSIYLSFNIQLNQEKDQKRLIIIIAINLRNKFLSYSKLTPL